MYNYIRQRISEEKETTTQPQTSDDPLKILKTRYAKGEITKEEYKELKEELVE